MSTLIINFFAGPCAGKSTLAAELFAWMKKRNYSVEHVPEFAKDLTWEQRFDALSLAPYVLGEQFKRTWVVSKHVDYVITDTSFLYQNIYKGVGWSDTLEKYSIELFSSFHNVNFVLRRNPSWGYEQTGRNQTADHARRIDDEMQAMLERWGMPYVGITASDKTLSEITDYLCKTKQI